MFSPDGSRIAFPSDWPIDDGEIFVINADGTNPINLTNTSTSSKFSPEWSPGGNRTAFTSLRGNNFDISTMKADASEKRRLTRNATIETTPAWSPDGNKIAFVGYRGPSFGIYTMRARTRDQQRLARNLFGDANPAWQPLVR